MDSNNELNTELESFRQQWLSDLQSKSSTSGSNQPPLREALPQASSSTQPPPSHQKPPRAANGDDDDDYLQGQSFDDAPAPTGFTLSGTRPSEPKELVSALDHFEEAMEREAQGNMGDSLKLYRQAYKVLTLSPMEPPDSILTTLSSIMGLINAIGRNISPSLTPGTPKDHQPSQHQPPSQLR